MKILSILVFTFFSATLFGQKCENFMQNIDMNGHFNISIFNDQSYLKNQKNEVEFIHLNKNSNHTNIIDFQKKFPDIYDGKCLSINDETFGSTNFKLCDKTVIQNQVGNNAILFGTFEIYSVLDEFYIIRFSGFEIGGFLIFDSFRKKTYVFETEPIFSKDKKFIFGYSNDYEGYHMNIREIGLERNLRYTLRGKYDLNHFKLYQFENSNKELLINLNKIIERDENFNLIDKKVCNLTLIIN